MSPQVRPSRRPDAILWPLAAALLAAGCGAGAPPGSIVIQSVDPPCPIPGDVLTVTLSGADTGQCAAGRMFLDGRELLAPVARLTPPPALSARLPEDLVPAQGAELRVVCGGATAAVRLFGACGIGARADAGGDAAPDQDAAPFCARPIEAVLDAVDDHGAAFPLDAAGVFQIPVATRAFSLDATGSRNVSGQNVTYTFTSDCYPTLTLRSPALGGLSAAGLGVGRRCAVTVAIVDQDCPAARAARAMASLLIVP